MRATPLVGGVRIPVMKTLRVVFQADFVRI